MHRFDPHTPADSRPLQQSMIARQYRMATFVVVTGALALGVLVLSRFTELYYDSIFFYYGLGETNYQAMREVGGLSMTIAQVFVAAVALCGIVAFVASERRRLKRIRQQKAICARRCESIGVERLDRNRRLNTLLRRTGGFAGVLALAWLLQISYERFVNGYGWGPLQYSDWTSLLPIGTVFLMCVLIGGFVAAVSMFGLRTIVALRQAFETRFWRRSRRRAKLPRPEYSDARTMRDLFGYEILSRPPPPLAV